MNNKKSLFRRLAALCMAVLLLSTLVAGCGKDAKKDAYCVMAKGENLSVVLIKIVFHTCIIARPNKKSKANHLKNR